MRHFALMGCASALAMGFASPSICSMAAEGSDSAGGSGGKGKAPAPADVLAETQRADAAIARAEAAEARLETATQQIAEASQRADKLEQELAPHRANELERGSDYVANLEKRLADASAVEPLEKVRGLIIDAGSDFAIEPKDGEEVADFFERFAIAAMESKAKLTQERDDAKEDLVQAETKLAAARKKRDPGAIAKGRSSKPRKLGADFDKPEGGNGDQSELDVIMAGESALELVFSNGTNEIMEFAPYDVRGASFERHAGGWRLRDAINLKGASELTRVRGVALLKDGKQIAWAPFPEVVIVPAHQEVAFDKMIVFA